MPTAGRSVSAAVLLVIGAGLAVLAVLVHYGFLAEYGHATDTAFEGLAWGFTAGPSGVALFLVAVVAVIGLVFSTRRWVQVTAGAIPVLVLLGMLAVTPAALVQKREMCGGNPICLIEQR
jgi:hypothetical protein